ncbi:putative sugar phosphatase of HAD superfamily [Saccharomonospora marina XMU15]|uniref:Putative sugar phosphatase of HAD superfamily n=1 Tax=Saccharomonospora marina XMU15 TaxID=882083 RepID=H5X8M2_9PSEU|nr:HAD family hydrolase [Saccharomonospora marina]EHR51391.1 putative sugar phosphatase of HAD superfamily [Saccharomonospora marina XMU15]
MSTAESELDRVKGFLFDLDGTLVLGDRRNNGLRPLPGALELIDWLRRREVPFVVFTNGTTRTAGGYAKLLAELGFGFGDDEVLTPASSAVEVLLRRGQRRVVVLGGDGLADPLRDAGIEVLPPRGRPTADAVLVGWYREFTMDTVEAACHAVWQGASLYSASQSVFFASADGKALGTSRLLCAAISSVTGARVTVVGKPSAHALRAACHRLGLPARAVAVVGDDPMLETPMARRGGAVAIAVDTGVSGGEEYADLPPGRRPHLRLPGVQRLLSILRARS